MIDTYASLINKSHYSCGIGIGTAEQLVKNAKEKKLKAYGITDHMSMGGVLDFYNEGKKQKFPVILGVELKVFEGMSAESFLIQFLCFNQTGYTNLCKLTTICHSNSTLAISDINENSEGIICLCDEPKLISFLKPIFEKNFYGVMNIYATQQINLKIMDLCGSNFIYSCDSSIPNEEDKILQDIMHENIITKKEATQFVAEPRFLRNLKDLIGKLVVDHKYLIPFMIQTGLKNTNKIADQCKNLELNFKDQIVNYAHLMHPLNTQNLTKEQLLGEIIRVNGRVDFTNKEYFDRYHYELDAITKNSRVNLIDYFLVLEDLVRFCRESNIEVGPGRGSGAGSLILYGLKITQLDPIEHGLIFERFISKGRIEAGTLPDVDLDFSDQERVREYLIDLYGDDRVRPIGTYQTLGLKGAIKDAFRVLYKDLDFKYLNHLTNLLWKNEEDSELKYFRVQLKENEAFRFAMLKHEAAIPIVKKLLGMNRQAGIHPCGLAITQDPLDDFLPVRNTDGKSVIEFSGDFCEQSGVIKYDLLGLKTLKFFQTCFDLIKKRNPNTLIKTQEDIPLHDDDTFMAFQEASTDSVFQFGSYIAKTILKSLTEVTSLNDISMVTAVGRPGPMKNFQHKIFIGRKNGDQEATAPHPSLNEILKDTYGIMIYQESVMQCSQIMGGFSLVEADDIRKAMGKKKPEILVPFKDRFIKHCESKYPDTKEKIKLQEGRIPLSHHIWNLMETFSGYGFNKAHSMSYALIGYYCQYLKIHHHLEWICACLEHAGDIDHLKAYHSAFRNSIHLPDAGKSTNEFYIEYFDDYQQDENGDQVEGMIHMPFNSVKGIGEAASKAVFDARPFKTFEQFYEKVDKRRANKTVVVSLIFAGAFDSLGVSDKEKLLETYYKLRKAKKIPEEHQNITKEYEVEKKYDALNFIQKDYIHIYPQVCGDLNQYKVIEHRVDRTGFNVVGKIIKLNIRKQKDPEGGRKKVDYAAFTIENNGQLLECRAWNTEYRFYKNEINIGDIVIIHGSVSKYLENKAQLHCKKVFTFEKYKKLRRDCK